MIVLESRNVSKEGLIKKNPYLHSVDKNHCLSALFAEFIPVIEGFWAMQ